MCVFDSLTRALLLLVSEKAEKVNYRKPGFVSKFLELQAVMCKNLSGILLLL